MMKLRPRRTELSNVKRLHRRKLGENAALEWNVVHTVQVDNIRPKAQQLLHRITDGGLSRWTRHGPTECTEPADRNTGRRVAI